MILFKFFLTVSHLCHQEIKNIWRKQWATGESSEKGVHMLGWPSVGNWAQAVVVFQLLSCVQLFVTPRTAAHQTFLSLTNSKSLLKLMSLESVMPSNHLILCHPLLLPSIFPSIRVFSSELVLHIRWSKYWSFSFSISPSSEFRVDFL